MGSQLSKNFSQMLPPKAPQQPNHSMKHSISSNNNNNLSMTQNSLMSGLGSGLRSQINLNQGKMPPQHQQYQQQQQQASFLNYPAQNQSAGIAVAPDDYRQQFNFSKDPLASHKPVRLNPGNTLSQHLKSQSSMQMPQAPLDAAAIHTKLETSLAHKLRQYNSQSQQQPSRIAASGSLLLQEIPQLIRNINSNLSPQTSEKLKQQLFIETPTTKLLQQAKVPGLLNPTVQNKSPQFKSFLPDRIRDEILKKQNTSLQKENGTGLQGNNIAIFQATPQQTNKNQDKCSEASPEEQRIKTFADVLAKFSQKKVADISHSPDFKFNAVYGFQRKHPGFKEKLKYSLNHEQEQKYKEEKEAQDKREAEERLKKEAEREKLQKKMVNYLIMNIRDQTLSREQYESKKNEDKLMVTNIVAFIKKKFYDRGMQAYRVLKLKRDISKYFTKYAMRFYKEYQRKKEMQVCFDDFDSDSPSPLKVRKPALGLGGLQRQSTINPANSSIHQLQPIKLKPPRAAAKIDTQEQLAKRRDEIKFKREEKMQQQQNTKLKLILMHDDEDQENQKEDINKVIMEEMNYQDILEAEQAHQKQKSQKASEREVGQQMENIFGYPVKSYAEKKQNKVQFVKKKNFSLGLK